MYTAADLVQAEMVRGLLIANGIEAIVVGDRHEPYPSIAEVNVLVFSEDLLRARYVVDKYRGE